MKIIIGFSIPKHKKIPLFSWAIRLYQKTDYSHVYLSWVTSKGDKVCYHASGTMLHFLGEQAFNQQVKPLYEFIFDITKPQYSKLRQFCLQKAGLKYGVLSIIGLVIGRFFKLDRNILSNKNTYICSELVAEVFKHIKGIDTGKDLELLTPKDIYKLCLIHGHKIDVIQ